MTTIDYTDTNLTKAHAEVKAEVFRTDNKASLLLAFNGAVLAGAWSIITATPLPIAALVALGVAAFVVVASAALLLAVVRPFLGGTDPVGFPYWATRTPAELLAEMAEDRRAVDIIALSRLAVRKMGALQRAIDLTRWSAAPFALAGLLAVIL